MRYCFRFPTENDFLCLFFRIWVETHFPLKHPSIYLCQVAIQFKSTGIAVMDHRKQGRIVSKKFISLIYIKNNNGPRMEPWGAPALTSDQSETCPSNKTLSFLFLRKSHKRFSNDGI